MSSFFHYRREFWRDSQEQLSGGGGEDYPGVEEAAEAFPGSGQQPEALLGGGKAGGRGDLRQVWCGCGDGEL